MSRTTRNLSLLLRCERLIASRRITVARQQTLAAAFAAVAAGIGLVMINVAAFFALADALGDPGAALIVGVANFALAGALFALSSRFSADKELTPVIEMRDAALSDLEAEIEGTLGEVKDAVGGLRRLTRDPLGGIAQELLVPLLAGLVQSWRHDTTPDDDDTDGKAA